MGGRSRYGVWSGCDGPCWDGVRRHTHPVSRARGVDPYKGRLSH